MFKREKSRRRMRATTSALSLGLTLVFIAPAMAQSVPTGGDGETAPEVAENGDAIVVVGARASQQSANQRKRNARTATTRSLRTI